MTWPQFEVRICIRHQAFSWLADSFCFFSGKDCLHCHLCPKDELKSRKKAKWHGCISTRPEVVALHQVLALFLGAQVCLHAAWCAPLVRVPCFLRLQTEWLRPDNPQAYCRGARRAAPGVEQLGAFALRMPFALPKLPRIFLIKTLQTLSCPQNPLSRSLTPWQPRGL